MIDNRLKEKQYYLDKLSLFLRNSYGVEEQVTLLWKTLVDIDSTIDDFFEAFKMLKPEGIDDLLDKIAEIVGCKRNLDVSYGSPLTSYTLSLSNEELIRSIKTRIIQNNYDGSFENFKKNYESIGLNVLATDGGVSGTSIQILNNDEKLTDNDKHMFLSGNYSIRSLGITYSFSMGDLDLIGFWDNILRTWNNSQWGE